VFNIGPTELIVILVIALIVFGPKRLPEIGRTMGKSLRELRKATEDIKGTFTGSLDDDEIEDEWNDPPKIVRTPDGTTPSEATAPAEAASSETEGEASPSASTVATETAPPVPTGPGAVVPSLNGSGAASGAAVGQGDPADDPTD